MKKVDDLSRWNRAGQKSMQYIDGSAPVYLEHIKEELKARYKGRWSALPELIEQREEKGLSEEQAQFQRNNELLDQYYKTDNEIGWNLAKVFSQACHVLTGHLNAYANEGFLRTITQWENVRRLVELIDYNPSSATSASTQIVLNVKKNRSGIVSKGFQIKYTPVTGGAKVIYETMEDVFLDDSLNQLRPKGWDQSDESPLSGGSDNSESQLFIGAEVSTISNSSVININGVGKKYHQRLNSLSPHNHFRIIDLYDFDISTNRLDIDLSRWQDLKTKAAFVCEFKLDPGWISVIDWFLPDILSESTESLAEKISDNLDAAQSFKSKVETLSLSLDNEVFIKTRLRDFIEKDSSKNDSSADQQSNKLTDKVKTSWLAKRKPKVAAGQVAMVYRELKNEVDDITLDEAEAVRIFSVDKSTNVIYVLPEKSQYSWFQWSRTEARLMVSPRWQKKCWLNGLDVIRTKKPHGLSQGDFICWNVQKSAWQFAKVIESDTFNLRLQLSEIASPPGTNVALPATDTKLYVARAITSQVMAADLIAIGLLVGVKPEIKDLNVGDSILPENGIAPDLSQPFKMSDPNPNDKPDLSNTALIPPGKLSFGSFLFPTPMLPMDLVKIAVDLMLSLGVMIIPSTGEIVFKSLLDISIPTAEQLLDLIEALDPDTLQWPGLIQREEQSLKAAKIEALEKMLNKQPPEGDPKVIFKEIATELEQTNPLVAVQINSPVIAVVAKKNPRFVVTGSFNKLETGDWLVGEFKDQLRALQINSINTLSEISGCEDFEITFKNNININLDLKKLYAEFRADLVAEDAAINSQPIELDRIELENMPENLKVGRKVLLMADGASPDPLPAKIESISGNFIKTKPPARGFKKGNLKIYANVVDASHGALKPVKRLSSGPAGEQSYSLLLNVENVSTVLDSTFTRGVRADIEVAIGGQIWQQVTGLDKSNPTDSHYLVRVTEDGYLRLIFTGRRLPSGANNVSVRYRVGAGRAGNLIKGSLIKPVSPHPLVETVMQPVASVGGENIELVDFMRENAPATLLALERSVSLVDFENLAMNRNDIWQAKAFYHPSDRSYLDLVTVVIIPAGSVDIDKTLTSEFIVSPLKNKTLPDEFKLDIEDYLTQKSVPTVSIRVVSYQPVEIKLNLKIRVDLASFDPIPVVERIRDRMLALFTLEYRKINQAFYLSEVYQVVETTQGVSDSRCVFQGGGSEHQILPEKEDQVLYLSYDPDHLLIEYEAYKA